MSNLVHINFKSFEISRLPSTRSSPCRLIEPNSYQTKCCIQKENFLTFMDVANTQHDPI